VTDPLEEQRNEEQRKLPNFHARQRAVVAKLGPARVKAFRPLVTTARDFERLEVALGLAQPMGTHAAPKAPLIERMFPKSLPQARKPGVA
jgi:hypothetical protein